MWLDSSRFVNQLQGPSYAMLAPGLQLLPCDAHACTGGAIDYFFTVRTTTLDAD